MERRNVSAMVRGYDGQAVTFGATLDINESMLSQLVEPHRYPVLSILRERLRRWRFYHQIRTDADSPLRAVQIGTRTPILAHDGHDLAPALQTIIENGDDVALAEAVADAFDGAKLHIESDNARFRLELETPGVYRPLDAAELSDGTLHYLALLAALHTPRPPELLVLNEPETSLHPRVLVPLARQIVAAAARSQVIVVSHAAVLVDAVSAARGATKIELSKMEGETIVVDRRRSTNPHGSGPRDQISLCDLMSDVAESLRLVVEHQRYAWVHVRDRSVHGFVVAANESLVLLHSLRDFDDNGYIILLTSAITEVDHDEPSLRFFEKMLRNEGILPGVGINALVPLDSFQTALTAIKAQNELVLLHRGLLEPESEFHVGGILEVGDDDTTMRDLTAWGEWLPRVHRLAIRELERVEFGSPYLRMLHKYSSPPYTRIATS